MNLLVKCYQFTKGFSAEDKYIIILMIIPKLLLILVPLLSLEETQNNLQRGSELIRPVRRPEFKLTSTVLPVLKNTINIKKNAEIFTQENISTSTVRDIEVTYKESEIINIPESKSMKSETEKPGLTIIYTKSYTENSTPSNSIRNLVPRHINPRLFRPRLNISYFSQLSSATPSTTIIKNILKLKLPSHLSTKPIYTSSRSEKSTESRTVTAVINTNTLESVTSQFTGNLQDITTLAPSNKLDKSVEAGKAKLTTNNMILEQNLASTTISELTTYYQPEIDTTKPSLTGQFDKIKHVSNETPIVSILPRKKSDKKSSSNLLSRPHVTRLETKKVAVINQISTFQFKNRQPEQTTAPNKPPVNIKKQAHRTVECPHLYGVFPVPNGDCGHFIMCQEGLATTILCPAGLAFNSVTSTCDWPVNVPGCNPNVFQDFSCPMTTSNKYAKPSHLIHNYKYKNSCKKYIACHEGRPRLLSCDAGLSFDEKTKKCVDSNLIKDCKN